MKKVEYTVISYIEYEDLVSKLINAIYENSIADYEWNNYSCYTFFADPRSLSQYHRDYIHSYISDPEHNDIPFAQVMLSYMASINMIDDGEYLIEVYW